MMDDSAPTHERRKFVKTYKIVLPQTMVAEACGETYSNNDKKSWNRKTAIGVNHTPQKKYVKGNAERERERESERESERERERERERVRVASGEVPRASF